MNNEMRGQKERTPLGKILAGLWGFEPNIYEMEKKLERAEKEILALTQPQLSEGELYNLIFETEVHSDTRDWYGEGRRTAEEIIKARGRNLQRIREVAHAIHSKLLGEKKENTPRERR